MENRIVELSDRDRAMLAGDMGLATQMAMRILVTMAGVYGAERLLDIESAHIDGCLYHGYSGLEFAERLAAGGARVVVPTTLNVGAMDLIHPEVFRGTEQVGRWATRMMEAYEAMGCRPTFTCAPYQAMHRPLWARRSPGPRATPSSSPTPSSARGRTAMATSSISAAPSPAARRMWAFIGRRTAPGSCCSGWWDSRAAAARGRAFSGAGLLAGSANGDEDTGHRGLLPDTTEDQFKALGAAAASSGGVALFHAVGVTPEAPTLEAAFQGRLPEAVIDVTLDDLRGELGVLSTVPDGPINVVALGSPHFSLDEFARLLPLVEQFPPRPDVEFIVCTHRLALVALQQRGWLERLRAAGVQVIVDTCVVVTPIVRSRGGVLMTNSGKFAHYSPGNIGLQVVYGGLEECVRSAAAGEVWRDASLWAGEKESGGEGEQGSRRDVESYQLSVTSIQSQEDSELVISSRQKSPLVTRHSVVGRPWSVVS
jgi:predicted aconitase